MTTTMPEIVSVSRQAVQAGTWARILGSLLLVVGLLLTLSTGYGMSQPGTVTTFNPPVPNADGTAMVAAPPTVTTTDFGIGTGERIMMTVINGVFYLAPGILVVALSFPVRRASRGATVALTVVSGLLALVLIALPGLALLLIAASGAIVSAAGGAMLAGLLAGIGCVVQAVLCIRSLASTAVVPPLPPSRV